MIQRLELTGQKFGRYTVVSFHSCTPQGTIWLCQCECGTIKPVQGKKLRYGSTKSCGCLQSEMINRNRIIKHNESGATTAEYRAWLGMKQRCYDTKFKSYDRYGGRGIKVCERWLHSYENFLADMGRKPSPRHSIDRFPNNDGDYEPSNCRWATPLEQIKNRNPYKRKKNL